MAYRLTQKDRELARQLAQQNYQMQVQAPQTSQTPQAPKKGFWLDQISTGTGIGGALGGAAAGAAAGSVVPVVGTAVGGILGALVGGGLGSGAGEVAENAITGDDLMRNVGKETLIGGATSLPIGAGFKLARAGGRAALGKAGARDLVQEAGIQTIGKGTVARGGRFGTQFDDEAMAAARRLQAGKGNTLQNAGKKSEQLGAKMLTSQAQVTGAQARRAGLKPVETFKKLNQRTGLTNLDDMAEISRGLTGAGDDSLLDTLTRAAVENTSGVDVGDLRKVATSLLDDKGTLLTDAQRNAVMRNVKNATTVMRGGSSGSLSPLANPNEALNQANALRGAAQTIKTSSLTASPEQKQLATIYDALARNIEDAIYKSPGVNDSIPLLRKAGADDLLFRAQDLRAAGNEAQAKAYEKIAKEVRGIKSVADLRKLKRDFVDVNKIDDFTAQAEGARAFNSEDAISQMRSRPIAGTIGALLNTGLPRAAGGLANAGRALQGAGRAAGTVAQGVVPLAARQAGTRALVPGEQAEAGVDPMLQMDGQGVPGMPGQATPGTDLAGMGGMGAPDAMQEPSIGGVTKSQLEEAMVMAAMEGNSQAFGQLQDIYGLLPQTAGGMDLDASTAKAMASSDNAEATVSQLEQLFNSAGGGQGPIGGQFTNLMGNVGLNNDARTFNDLSRGSVAQIARAMGETGTISDADVRTYSAMLPRMTDPPQVAQAKIAALRERLQIARQNTLMYGAGVSPEQGTEEQPLY